jgi:hypothetical protein
MPLGNYWNTNQNESAELHVDLPSFPLDPSLVNAHLDMDTMLTLEVAMLILVFMHTPINLTP